MICTVVLAAAACSADPASQEPEGAQGAAEQTGYFTDFTADTIAGTEITQDVFQDRDVTLVNVMATWCNPCIAEMPELENLYQEGKTGVVGIVLDTAEKGTVDEQALSDAQYIADALDVTYPLLVPDASGFNGMAQTITAFPTSYFVNSAGEIIGGPYQGSRDLESWQQLAAQASESAA